jgi:hypothetical protein
VPFFVTIGSLSRCTLRRRGLGLEAIEWRHGFLCHCRSVPMRAAYLAPFALAVGLIASNVHAADAPRDIRAFI